MFFFSSPDCRAERAKAARDAAGTTTIKAVNISDLAIGKLDPSGETVLAFLGRKPPDFAVYQTENRVSVQFADEKARADDQRKAIATLNPIRGEINGLIDGWRLRPTSSQRYRKAARFDRRVGDALVYAFEDDVPDAALILTRIKQDVIDERTAFAKVEYLFAAFVVAAAAIGIALLAGWLKPQSGWLWSAEAAGAVGAFFSIAIGIRSRTVLPDLLWLANTMDAFLRMIIGMIGASVLFALLDLKLVALSFGNTPIAPNHDDPKMWLMVLIIGFVAGFSERLVPDILATAVAKPADPPPPRRDADRQPAAGKKDGDGGGGGGGGGGGATTADDDPSPDQADIDHCLCDLHSTAEEATRDEDLPAATGGVAPPPKP